MNVLFQMKFAAKIRKKNEIIQKRFKIFKMFSYTLAGFEVSQGRKRSVSPEETHRFRP